ncbi:RBBP9/YdeN family alpha/beta hydrolase [Saccharothrix sp. ST-888]|uniref:RBBP9/YdeN family alpha/beta hydrolase n=1 Tax=Saccharothrix sp. ST-888 TaxID=1427391 RepID=UPI0005ED3A82|nr:alpha/beta hydrolase [Saccharothrix sp. ST-888]KJK55478.1 hypothetical protein UK12_28315 [Saccharothrix sp. ST-888]
MTAEPTFLVLPGYQNSGPEHWQSRWERQDPAAFRRVEQGDWDHPSLGDWVDTLDRAVIRALADGPGPVVLVAHSLGCTTVAHWAAAHSRPVRAALLVAPPDIETAEVPELFGFRPIPRQPLPFPSLLASSSDDPWCSTERARAFADSWGSAFVDAGAHGHLNSDSGLGDWPEGRELLARLLETEPGAGAIG